MPTLYAEFLPNIKKLTIITTLDTPRDGSTSLWADNKRSEIVLKQGDDIHRIGLPAKITPDEGNQIRHLQLPGKDDLQSVSSLTAEPLFKNTDVIVPWTASALDLETELRCRKCSTIVSTGKVKVWKDLPSEAWAEMMDLWHCHKPAEPEHSHDEAPAKKGYAAGSKLVARTGTGFVDVMSFLLAEADCSGIEVSNFPHIHSRTYGSKEGVLCGLEPCPMGAAPIQRPKSKK